jgi:hypothetical protein
MLSPPTDASLSAPLLQWPNHCSPPPTPTSPLPASSTQRHLTASVSGAARCTSSRPEICLSYLSCQPSEMVQPFLGARTVSLVVACPDKRSSGKRKEESVQGNCRVVRDTLMSKVEFMEWVNDGLVWDGGKERDPRIERRNVGRAVEQPSLCRQGGHGLVIKHAAGSRRWMSTSRFRI